MTGAKINAIVVDRTADETERLRALFETSGPSVSLEHAPNLESAIKKIIGKRVDVVLLDLELEDSQGLTTLARFLECAGYLPAVVMLEPEQEKIAEAALQSGAQDYLVRGRFDEDQLMRSIRYSIDRKQAGDKLLRLNKHVREANRALERSIAKSNQLVKDAEAADAEKHRFLTKLSHEIHTPINGIVPMIGMLLESELDWEQRELAQMVSASADALVLTIRDRLDVTRLIEGGLELEEVSFDLRTMLEEMNNLLALNAQDKGLEYVCLIEREVPTYLKGDPGRLRQILLALVGNAVKLADAGEVVLNVTLDGEDDAKASVRFTVRGSCANDEPDGASDLFDANDPVDQGDIVELRSDRSELIAARQLADLMGGEIEVKRETGSGDSCSLTAVFKKQSLDQVPAEEIAEILDGTRVLVVDNSAMVRRACATLLSTWNCHCYEAKDAADAVEALRAGVDEREPFSAVLIDTDLSGISGVELGKLILNDSKISRTELIMMTGYLKRGETSELKKMGFSACLVKPLRRKPLYDSLVMVLGCQSDVEGATERAVMTDHFRGAMEKLKLRILLVEDNMVNQKVALKLLSKLGYQAELVENGLEAVRALITTDYDLVLMDILMPQMDGMEATRIIRDPTSAVRNHDIPVIAMTAHAVRGARERCLEVGMNEYVPKPIDPELLAAAIEKWRYPSMR